MRKPDFPVAPVIALALAAVAVPVSAAEPADGDPVLWWNQVYLDALPAPTGFQRNSASFNIAMHDAVNTVLGRPNYAYIYLRGTSGGDVRAAAAQAAHDTLMVRAPAQAAVWTAALATQLALVPDGTAKEQGRATGAKHAAAILAARATDGTGTPTAYTPSGLPGRWAPTPPGFAPAANTWLGNVTPWLTTGNDQFRPGSPPAIDSADYTAAFADVRLLGAASGSTRTAAQTDAALFWGATPGARLYLRAAIDQSQAEGQSTIENAALFARLHVALADVTQANQNTAYHYDFWRPVTAIRAGDLDGNPDTIGDPGWTPLVAASPFPSYSAIPVSIGSALAGVLDAQFGHFAFCGTFASLTRCFDSAGDAVAESVDASVWGGAWWRFDAEAGAVLGEDIASWTLAQNEFGAVPEPGAWAMLLTGFGLVGAAARRRRQLPKGEVA
jgi:hypothetical protein